MALVLNEEQVMLKDAARDFLQGRAPVSHLRKIRDEGAGKGFSQELWQEMVDLGWSAILVPEAHGGLDYGYTGMGIVLEETGRTLTPSPLLGTALVGVAAIRLAGSEKQAAAILPEVAAGRQLLALACDEVPRHDPAQVATRALDTPEGFSLSGQKTAVLDGQAADRFIVSAMTDDGLSLFLVPADAPGVQVEPMAALDIGRNAELRFDKVALGAEQRLGEAPVDMAVLDKILDAARVGAAAEMLGLAQEAFERTVEYLKERRQFGVPIGSFQALQHRAAFLWGELETCKSLVLKALQTLDEAPEESAQLASMTKAKLGETARLAANEAIQMHGGIGMTDEFDIGFFLKRCQILDTLYGDRYYHLDRYARLRGY